jgi:hypothetical protein
MNITVRNPQTKRESTYDMKYLAREARRMCKPYGKMHAWNVEVVEGVCVRLHASYTAPDDVQSFVTQVL